MDGWERDGGAFCVFENGEAVVDIWGGYADKESRRPWREDTMNVAFSSSKASRYRLWESASLSSFSSPGYGWKRNTTDSLKEPIQYRNSFTIISLSFISSAFIIALTGMFVWSSVCLEKKGGVLEFIAS